MYLVPPIGGAERKLATELGCEEAPLQQLTWSPDSKQVGANLLDQATGRCRIVLLPVDGGPPIPLTDPPPESRGDASPVISFDGHRLAFTRQPAAFQQDILVVDLEGSPPAARGRPRQITHDAVSINGLAWSGDGNEIIFASIRGGTSSALWRVLASGQSPPRLLEGVGAYGFSPAISRRGDLLAFQESRSDTDIWRVDGPAVRTGRRPPVRLISSTFQDNSQRYSPDGRKIAFCSQRSGANEVWVSDSDGSNPVQLTRFGRALNGTPRWSPDSRWIVLDSRIEGQPDIYVISAEGGALRRLTSEPTQEVVPSWSHDGRWIYFGSNRSGEFQVWKMPAEGGAARQITRKGGFAALESSDGKFIYYAKGRNYPGIWKAPVDGGEESLVIEDAGGQVWGHFDVLPDGICYVPYKPSLQPSILFLDFATGRTRVVQTLEKPVLRVWPGFSVSPGGRWIAYTQIDSVISDLMLVENFR